MSLSSPDPLNTVIKKTRMFFIKYREFNLKQFLFVYILLKEPTSEQNIFENPEYPFSEFRINYKIFYTQK